MEESHSDWSKGLYSSKCANSLRCWGRFRHDALEAVGGKQFGQAGTGC